MTELELVGREDYDARDRYKLRASYLRDYYWPFSFATRFQNKNRAEQRMELLRLHFLAACELDVSLRMQMDVEDFMPWIADVAKVPAWVSTNFNAVSFYLVIQYIYQHDKFRKNWFTDVITLVEGATRSEGDLGGAVNEGLENILSINWIKGTKPQHIYVADTVLTNLIQRLDNDGNVQPTPLKN